MSENLGLLSSVVLALAALTRPLLWEHPLVPVMPIEMGEILSAPVPYLIGAIMKRAPARCLPERFDFSIVGLYSPRQALRVKPSMSSFRTFRMFRVGHCTPADVLLFGPGSESSTLIGNVPLFAAPAESSVDCVD